MNPSYQVKHSDILLVNCEPSVGAEIRKIRPCLVIQGEKLNRISALISVLPITSQTENPFFADVPMKKNAENNLSEDSLVRTSQIFTYDRSRFLKLVGRCSKEVLDHVKKQLIRNFELESSV